MKRKEIVEKIKQEEGGRWNIRGLEFRIDGEDGTIHVSSEGFSAFLMNHCEDDMNKWHFSSTKDLENVNELIRFAQKIIDVVEADIRIAGSIERQIIKEVNPEHDDFMKAKGHIEAYENIMLGRSITIG